MTRKTVLITGASAGIGAACARLLARHGYDVAIGYRSDAAGAEAVARDVEAAGGRAVLLQADVGDPADIERMFAELDAAFPAPRRAGQQRRHRRRRKPGSRT